MFLTTGGALESDDNEAHVPVPFLVSSRGWGLFVRTREAGAFDVASSDPHVQRHSQAAHFNILNESRMFADFNSSDVFIVRGKAIEIEHNCWHEPERVRTQLSGKEAYCAQECLDLMDGITIWRRALLQASSGVNRRWLSNLMNRFDD